MARDDEKIPQAATRADFDDHVRRRQPVIYRPWPDVTALADDISRSTRGKRLPTQFPPPQPALPPPPFDAFLSYLTSYIGLDAATAHIRGARAFRALVHFRHRPALPGGGAGDGRARQHHAHRRDDRGHRLLDLERRLRDRPALGRLRAAQLPLLGLRREGGVCRRSRPVRGALLRRRPALPHALRRRRRSDAARRPRALPEVRRVPWAARHATRRRRPLPASVLVARSRAHWRAQSQPDALVDGAAVAPPAAAAAARARPPQLRALPDMGAVLRRGRRRRTEAARPAAAAGGRRRRRRRRRRPERAPPLRAPAPRCCPTGDGPGRRAG